jgi:hypothetical protein
MYNLSTYLVDTYSPTYLPIYETYFLQKLVTKVKPNINSVQVHPHLSNKGDPVDHWWVLVHCFFFKFRNLAKEKITRFLKQDPADSQNTKGFFKAFLLSYLVYSQIWLNLLFVDERQFGYITKIGKKEGNKRKNTCIMALSK